MDDSVDSGSTPHDRLRAWLFAHGVRISVPRHLRGSLEELDHPSSVRTIGCTIDPEVAYREVGESLLQAVAAEDDFFVSASYSNGYWMMWGMCCRAGDLVSVVQGTVWKVDCPDGSVAPPLFGYHESLLAPVMDRPSSGPRAEALVIVSDFRSDGVLVPRPDPLTILEDLEKLRVGGHSLIGPGDIAASARMQTVSAFLRAVRDGEPDRRQS